MVGFWCRQARIFLSGVVNRAVITGVIPKCVSVGAVGAQTPVDDLGLVDRETVVIRCDQARGIADGAVDVGDDTAGPAHDVVVVVGDA